MRLTWNTFRPFLISALLLLLLLVGAAAKAQNVGIGTATPDASAVLDLTSTGKGMLVPRMTAAQRAAIASPANGLLVYQTNGFFGFWYNGGTATTPHWVYLDPNGDNLGNHTATQALNLQGNALIGMGGSIGTAVGLGVRADGGLNIGQNAPGNNILLGYQSGQALTTGSQNQFAGYQSGLANTTGSFNQFDGYQSGRTNQSGDQNLFSGYTSGQANTTGSDNLFVGFQSGQANTQGQENHFVGYKSGYNSTTGSFNQFEGNQSGFSNSTGFNNLFSGYGSGSRNTVGHDNQFVGYLSGASNQGGNFNYFSGNQSGQANVSGDNNHFSGYQSGLSNVDGSLNHFVGYQSGMANTSGDQNHFDGYKSGLINTLGYQNLFVGFQSGANNTLGSNNQFIGYNSGVINSLGNQNLFVGYQSGAGNTTGSNNWAFGYNAGPNTNNLTNAGALGYNAVVSQSNSLVLGGTGPDAVKVGIGTTAPRGRFDVAGGGDTYLVADPSNGNSQSLYLPGHLYLAPFSASTPVAFIQARIPSSNSSTNLGLTLRTTLSGNVVNALQLNANGSAVFAGSVTAVSFSPSDARLKQDVRALDGALAAVRQLRAVRYHYRQDVAGHPLPQGAQVGVLAQELEKVYPELVSTGPDGYKAVNYAQLTPVLLEAIKELQAQVETLSKQVETSSRHATQAGAASVQRDVQAEAAMLSFEQRLRQLESAGVRAQVAR